MEFDFTLRQTPPRRPGATAPGDGAAAGVEPVVLLRSPRNAEPLLSLPADSTAESDASPRFDRLEQTLLATEAPKLGSFEEQCKAASGVPLPVVSGYPTGCAVPTAGGESAPASPLSTQTQALRGQLNETDQARFDRLAGALQGSRRAHDALQGLLQAGRLTQPTLVDARGHTLLAALDALASTPKAAGIQGQALLAQVVEEVASPPRINQGVTGTCAATTIQLQLARENPAEYVRVITGLTGAGRGSVQLAGGVVMTRIPGTEVAGEVPVPRSTPLAYTADLRSASSRIFQSAAMQLAVQERGTYSVRDDKVRSSSTHRLKGGLSAEENTFLSNAMGLTPGGRTMALESFEPGLTAELQQFRAERASGVGLHQAVGYRAQADRLSSQAYAAALDAAIAHPSVANAARAAEALDEAEYRHRVNQVSVAGARAADATLVAHQQHLVARYSQAVPQLIAAIGEQVARGREVQVTLRWSNASDHEILVTAMDASSVTYNNPQGQIETISRFDFDRRVSAATVRP